MLVLFRLVLQWMENVEWIWMLLGRPDDMDESKLN